MPAGFWDDSGVWNDAGTWDDGGGPPPVTSGRPLGLLLGITDGTPSAEGSPLGLLLALTHSSGISTQLETGSFILSGKNANLVLNSILLASSRSYALTGQDAAFHTDQPEAVQAYTLTGVPASSLNVTLTTTPASFTLTGIAAALTPSGSVSMVATPASFTLTGKDTLFNSGIVAAQQSFALSGVNAALDRGLPASVGAYTLTGVDAKFNIAEILTPVSFSYLGVPLAGLSVGLGAAVRSYALSGVNASFGLALKAAVTPYVLTGQDVSLNATGQASRPHSYGVIF